MNSTTNNYQKQPLKLYIQDIFRASRLESNRYVYELFGMSFKNIMIHGIVTSVYNNSGATVNLELSDPTGTVQIYYDSRKHNHNIPTNVLKTLHQDWSKSGQFGDPQADIKLKMLDAICERKQKATSFSEGNFVSVVGDIFLDDMRHIRMVSAYQCEITSLERDIIWLEELKYLYEKFYLWIKEG